MKIHLVLSKADVLYNKGDRIWLVAVADSTFALHS